MVIQDGKATGVKIAYIGGGSRGWAWGLMSDLATEESMNGTVCLYDIDFQAAKDNEIIGNKIKETEGVKSVWKYEAVRTLEEALTERKFGKIYIMLGINELGRGTTESFFNVYADAVNRIRMLQPDAVIFIQGIMRVGEEKNNTDAIFNNTNINGRNQAISLMADNRTIFYLEVNDAVCDENGNLISEYTFDQIHLKAKYYQLWKDYLFAHGIVRN